MGRFTNTLTFPFNTCEKVNDGIAQPYSTAVNALNCAVLLYFLIQSKTNRARILISALLAFETFHTFSHAFHLAGNMQTNMAHLLAYVINASFLYYFADFTKRAPSPILIVVLLALVALDIYSFAHLPLVFYMSTQAAMFLTAYFFYYNFLSQTLKSGFIWLISLSSTILILVWNEMTNCAAMMNWWIAPYHALVELVGLAMFALIGKIFQ